MEDNTQILLNSGFTYDPDTHGYTNNELDRVISNELLMILKPEIIQKWKDENFQTPAFKLVTWSS